VCCGIAARSWPSGSGRSPAAWRGSSPAVFCALCGVCAQAARLASALPSPSSCVFASAGSGRNPGAIAMGSSCSGSGVRAGSDTDDGPAGGAGAGSAEASSAPASALSAPAPTALEGGGTKPGSPGGGIGIATSAASGNPGSDGTAACTSGGSGAASKPEPEECSGGVMASAVSSSAANPSVASACWPDGGGPTAIAVRGLSGNVIPPRVRNPRAKKQTQANEGLAACAPALARRSCRASPAAAGRTLPGGGTLQFQTRQSLPPPADFAGLGVRGRGSAAYGMPRKQRGAGTPLAQLALLNWHTRYWKQLGRVRAPGA
jgi:hypothetical protein